MENVRLVLEHARTNFDQVVMSRFFLSDFRYYQSVNQIDGSYFNSKRLPIRIRVGVLRLAS